MTRVLFAMVIAVLVLAGCSAETDRRIADGIAAAHERGLVSRVTDGFAAGDRAALTVTCTYPTGEQVVCNVLADIRDGRIARWTGVQAWDA